MEICTGCGGRISVDFWGVVQHSSVEGFSWPGRFNRTEGTLEFFLDQILCDSQFLEMTWTVFLKCFPHILRLGPFSL